MLRGTSGACSPDTDPSAGSLAAEVAAARDVVIELRELLDRFSIHLANATRMFDEAVSDADDDSWIESCHATRVAALWLAVADFRSTLENAVERASRRDPSSPTGGSDLLGGAMTADTLEGH